MDKGLSDQMLTVGELQAWLRCGRTMSYWLVSSGTIRSYRVGRSIRVRRRDVEDYLENRCRADVNE